MLPINRRSLSGLITASGLSAMAGSSLAQGTKAYSPRPSIETYIADPLMQSICLSPDGKRIAYITQKGDEKYMIYFDLVDPKPKSLLIGAFRIFNLYFLSPNLLVLILADVKHKDLSKSSRAGYESFFYDISKQEIVDMNKKIRSKNNKNIIFNFLWGKPFRKNGSYMLSVVGKVYNNYDVEIYTANLNIDTFEVDNYIPIGSFNGDWIITPEGHPIAYSDYSGPSYTWSLFYNQNGQGQDSHFKKIYSVTRTQDPPQLLGLGRDGQSVVVKMNEDKNGGDYFEIKADGTISAPLDSDGERGKRSALFHPTTGRLIGFMRQDDWFTYDFFDPLMKKLAQAVPKIIGDDYRTDIAAMAEDPRKMILYTEGADDAGSYYFYDFTNGNNISLGRKYPELPTDWITEKKPITYKAADGLDIHAYVTYPVGKIVKNLPLIVMPHGGPEARDFGDYDGQVQALASRGYAVLQPNFRGSSGYGLEFMHAGYGEWGRKMQSDLSDGVRYLVSLGTVDAKRVAIVGASFGGYAALIGATMDHGLYACAVSIAGMSDLKSMLKFDEKKFYYASQTIQYLKQQLGDLKLIDDYSAINHVKDAYCPILLIHGEDDSVVNIEQSKKMNAALKSAGKIVEFISYKGQDHWETIESARIMMMKSVIAFLDKYNPA